MKFPKINFKDKRIWILLIIILAILYSTNPIDEKKESAGEWGRVGIGIAGLVFGIGLFFVPGGQVTGAILAVGSIGLFVGAGSLFSGIAGLLTPDKGIPIWIWLVGFFVLIMIMKRRD